MKARLVARGFEDNDDDHLTDSPTCAKESLRMVLAAIASKQWKCMSLDVKTAFLQSSTLEREVFIIPPKEAQTNKLWKLNKAVYGLNEASRQWYNRVYDELLKLGLHRSMYDEALFYWKKNGKLEGVIAVHVDDFLFGGTDGFHKEVIERLKTVFEIGKIWITPLRYCGLTIKQVQNGITIDQQRIY